MARFTYGNGDYRAGESAIMARCHATLPVTRRPILSLHGAGGNALGDQISPYGETLQVFADSGYPVHAGDYGSSAWRDSVGGIWNFGNSDNIAAINAAVTWLGSQPGIKTDKVFLIGGSMGAAAALNYYKSNPTKIAAIALTIPLLDMNDLASNDKGFVRAGVDPSMYGLSLPQATITLNETVAAAGIGTTFVGLGFNQYTQVNVLTSAGWQLVTTGGSSGSTLTGCSGGTGTLSSSSVVSQGYGASLVNAYGVVWPNLLSSAQLSANSPVVWAESAGGLTVPVKIWASDNDPIASNTSASQAFAAAVQAAGGGNVTPIVESLGAVGHNGTSTKRSDLLAWFDANGGRA